MDGVIGTSLPQSYDVIVEISIAHSFFRVRITQGSRQRSHMWDLADLMLGNISPRERVHTMIEHIAGDLQHG